MASLMRFNHTSKMRFLLAVTIVCLSFTGCSHRPGLGDDVAGQDSKQEGKEWCTKGFEAFRQGTFGNAGHNLYVSQAGVLQRMHQFDLTKKQGQTTWCRQRCPLQEISPEPSCRRRGCFSHETRPRYALRGSRRPII